MDNRQKKMAFLGVLLLGCVATSWFEGSGAGKQAVQPALVQKQLSAGSVKESKNKSIEVYVNGAVREPGIYTLPVGARTTEALEAASGLLPEARAERVNLAKKLRDGSQVYVPFAKNSAAQGSGGAGSAAKNRTKAGAYDKLDAGDSSGKLNLNTASQEQLIALPGIGPSMANRILALRRTRRFHKVEDLLQVRGIGQAKLERLRRYVTVE